MKKLALYKRYLLPLLIVGIVSIFSSALYMFTANLQKTKEAAQQETQKLEYVLDLSKSLVIEQVYSSMELLKQQSLNSGAPNINGVIKLKGEMIPKLNFGQLSQTGLTELVDGISNLGNGTATIFVKHKNTFIRIATNVKDKNNKRAIGTRLDPKGKVIHFLNAQQSFYGVVDILGEPYITGYEPILDNQKQVIGAWYVGYKVDLSALDQAIKKWTFLEKGFAVITDYNNNVRFLSNRISTETATQALKNLDNRWLITDKNISEWNFHAYILLPLKDAYLSSLTPLYPLLVLGGLFGVLLMVMAQNGIRRFVLLPLGGDPETASRLVKSIEQGNFEDDLITAEPDTLIDNMVKMRSRIRQMVNEINEKSDRLNTSAQVFEHAHDGIFITNPEGKIIDINPAFTEISGFTKEDAINKTPYELGFAYQLERFFIELFESENFHQGKRGEVWCLNKSGREYGAWLDMFPVRNDNAELLHYVGLFSDNTVAKQQQKVLEKLAYHDALTQLPNRVLFSEYLQKALEETEASKEMIAICYLDLDDFKPINDQHGHEIGDQLLVLLANRFRKNCNENDVLARLGGDEFALLLKRHKTTESYSQRINELLSAIEQPFFIGNYVFYISASIGFTIFPNDNSPPDVLLRHADHAMYHAKTHGGKQHYLFDLNLAQASQNEQQLKEDLIDGLKNDQFLLQYQPQISLEDGSIIGMEALIRWQHPTRGYLHPDDFLPVIENTNLIIDLGEWVILKALAQINQWQQEGLQCHISINIAAHHITNKDFTSFLTNAIKSYADNIGSKINIEITESAAINDIESVIKTIEVCKKMGVQFSLDDFGVGYSSLIYLRKLPVDFIKIDRSFTSGMLNDAEDLAVVSSITTLSHEFNRKVIAEGAESNEQLKILRTLNCNYAQGYVIAKPMPSDQVINWVKTNQPFKYH
jgi:diguanylate cyclase (GGDEF)-like protein/PAS domain S-box-containing protein